MKAKEFPRECKLNVKGNVKAIKASVETNLSTVKTTTFHVEERNNPKEY